MMFELDKDQLKTHLQNLPNLGDNFLSRLSDKLRTVRFFVEWKSSDGTEESLHMDRLIRWRAEENSGRQGLPPLRSVPLTSRTIDNSSLTFVGKSSDSPVSNPVSDPSDVEGTSSLRPIVRLFCGRLLSLLSICCHCILMIIVSWENWFYERIQWRISRYSNSLEDFFFFLDLMTSKTQVDISRWKYISDSLLIQN